MPESSAMTVVPSAAAAARALPSAFSANVVPVSGGSSTSGGSATTSWGASSAANSCALWSLRVARTSFMVVLASSGGGRAARRDRLVLQHAQLRDAGLGEVQQLIKMRPAQRRAFGRGLNLD